MSDLKRLSLPVERKLHLFPAPVLSAVLKIPVVACAEVFSSQFAPWIRFLPLDAHDPAASKATEALSPPPGG